MSGRRARVSSSHSRLTASGQPGTFWTSSIIKSACPESLSRPKSRAASHCCWIQLDPRKAGSSALAYRWGKPALRRDLRHQSGLAHLAGSKDHLQEPTRFLETTGELGALRPAIFRFTHDAE